MATSYDLFSSFPIGCSVALVETFNKLFVFVLGVLVDVILFL